MIVFSSPSLEATCDLGPAVQLITEQKVFILVYMGPLLDKQGRNFPLGNMFRYMALVCDITCIFC